MTARAAHVFTARALLAEARKRRGSAFFFVLLLWAGNARRRAASCRAVQRDLFGVAA